MRRAGHMSWRFAEGLEQLPVVALYVRDALGLVVPPGELIPPRPDAELPDCSGVTGHGDRIAAGTQWTDWWTAVVAGGVRPGAKRHHRPTTGSTTAQAFTAPGLIAWRRAVSSATSRTIS